MAETVVILDPVTEWRAVVAAAQRLKLRVVVVFVSVVPDRLKKFVPTAESLREDFGVDYVLDDDAVRRDVYECVRRIELLHPDRLSFEAVLPLSETAVEYSDTVAAMLGVPTHNTLHSVLCRRDKGFMKDAVARAGLPVASYARVRSVDQLSRNLARLAIDYPVVVKTPQGFSTTDVHICHTQGDACRAVNAIVGSVGPDGRQNTSHALLEQYIDGIEFAVNLMAFCNPNNQLSPMSDAAGSRIIVTDMWKYDKRNNANYKHAEICDPAHPQYEHIIDYARRVATAVGIRCGAAHVELKALPGHNAYRRPVMIEVGARLSGGSKSSLTQHATEHRWDPFETLIQSHRGRPSAHGIDVVRPTLFARHLFLPIEHGGVVRNIDMPDFASVLPTYHSHAVLVEKGRHVQETSDITSCAGFVWLVGPRTSVDHDTVTVRDTFKLDIDQTPS